MDLGLKGKKVLITGAGRGLGRAIAEHLSKEGACIAAVARTHADVWSLVDDLGGDKHYAIAKDLTESDSAKSVVQEVQEKFGHPDILINNLGGTLDVTDPFCSMHDWQRIWRFNMEVAIEFNNLVMPHMRQQRWGRIVNVSSISSLENQGPVTYCTVKAALTAYTRSMGRVLAPEGVVMTALLPGAVFTEGGYWDYTSKQNPEHVEKYLNERMAIKRFGTLDEIGSVAAFLCSEQVSFCVGSSFLVDGGQGKGFYI